MKIYLPPPPPSPRLWRACTSHLFTRGQSLIEILIATAVGSLMIIGAITIIAPVLKGNTQAVRAQVASSLGRAMLENLKVTGEYDWHDLYSLNKTSSTTYFLNPSRTPFQIATGTEGVMSDGILEGLIEYLKFDEATGYVALDFSGRNNTGVLVNGPVSSSSCNAGRCLVFNGLNSYVEVLSTSSLKYTGGNMTISAWVYVNPTDVTGGYIISKPWNSNSFYNYSLQLDPSMNIVFQLYGTSGFSLSSATSVARGVWHHIGATVDSAKNVALYLDGVSVGAGTHTISGWSPPFGDSDTSLVMGSLYPYGTLWGGQSSFTIDGLLNDIRLYNRALSGADIATIFKSFTFTRYFYIENVSRDVAGYITDVAGVDDPSTQKVTVVYGWSGATPNSLSTYLMRTANRVFLQSDWSGGSGQNGPITSPNNKFASSTNIDYASSSGAITVDGF